MTTWRELGRAALLGASSLVTFAMVWFVTMELILRHAGYPFRVAVAVAILAQSTWTARNAYDQSPASWLGVKVPAMFAGALGFYLVVRTAGAVHFEGYLALIGVLLVAQALLAVATPPGTESGRPI